MSNPIASSSILLRSIVYIVLIAFILTILEPLPVYAQGFSGLRLPSVGVRVSLSPEFNPAILKGVKVHTDNPLRFDFILDKGDGSLSQEELKEESSRLIKYFLAAVTLPDKDVWVNLSPYEKDRIIPDSFGATEMGRDLLAQDYLLKQITASLIYPEDEIGKKFWKRVYEEAAKKYKTTSVPVNTFNKIWIVPEKAVVYENAKAGTAYVVESKLKVMLEQDYIAIQKNQRQPGDMASAVSPSTLPSKMAMNVKASQSQSTNELASQIVREIILPELEKEVNTAKNFIQLRQVYHSLILATWYKKKIKDSILAKVYVDQNKTAGVKYEKSVILRREATKDHKLSLDSSVATLPQNDKTSDTELIYQQYLQAFKKGVYNYIKEETDPLTQETIPRKYFSGGVDFMISPEQRTNLGLPAQVIDFTSDKTMVSQLDFNNDNALQVTADMAMTGDKGDETEIIKPKIVAMVNADKKAYSFDTVVYSNQSAKVLYAGQGLAIPLELLSKLGSIKLWLEAKHDSDRNENIVEISKAAGNVLSIKTQIRRNDLLIVEEKENDSLTIPSNTGSLKVRLGRATESKDGIKQITAFEDDDYVSREHLEIVIEKGWLVLKNISSRSNCYLPTEVFNQILAQLSELPSLEGARYGIDNLGDKFQEIKKGNIRTIALNDQEFFVRVGKTVVAVKKHEKEGYLYAVRIDPKDPQRVLSRPVPLTIHHISGARILEIGKTPNGGFFMMNMGVSSAWIDDQVQPKHVVLSVSASKNTLTVDTNITGQMGGDVRIKIGSYVPGDLGEDLAMEASKLDQDQMMQGKNENPPLNIPELLRTRRLIYHGTGISMVLKMLLNSNGNLYSPDGGGDVNTLFTTFFTPFFGAKFGSDGIVLEFDSWDLVKSGVRFSSYGELGTFDRVPLKFLTEKSKREIFSKLNKNNNLSISDRNLIAIGLGKESWDHMEQDYANVSKIGQEFKKGGIDLTADQMTLNIQNSGKGIQLNIDSDMLQKLQNAAGLTPVIINIQPLNSLPMFLGMANSDQSSV